MLMLTKNVKVASKCQILYINLAKEKEKGNWVKERYIRIYKKK